MVGTVQLNNDEDETWETFEVQGRGSIPTLLRSKWVGYAYYSPNAGISGESAEAAPHILRNLP